MVCSLHFIMTDATTVECSSLTWSTGMQIWRDKRNCLLNKSVQIPHDLLGFQHGDGPHVSKYDKLWTKIYLVDINGSRERSTSKSNFRKSFAPRCQRIQTEHYLMFFSLSSWRVSLSNSFQIPGPQRNLFKDNIADVFTQRIEFGVFCTAGSYLQNTA